MQLHLLDYTKKITANQNSSLINKIFYEPRKNTTEDITQ